MKDRIVRYSQRDIAFMLQVSTFISLPRFAKKVGESPARIQRMAAQKIKPSPSVLRFFHLTQDGKDYVWHLL